ncbi:NYN domain-containing protein [Oryzobacter telluris]|uniref:NYN domain-containing protein n=1 Tax=Oryzobacter telluris TaxID=3149179 RepID=UPI00370DBCBB
MDSPARIALLIDADNARAARIDVILSELSAFGETSIRRAYGNWTKSGLKSWTAVLHDHGIRPVQQFDPSKGKNASDIALAVDAVEILHTQRPDAFALVSSDADFTPLVMHLREHGVAVYGFGDAKTPAPFQSACSRFLVLDRLAERTSDPRDEDAADDDTGTREESDSAPLRVPPEQLRADQKLVSLLRRAVESAADESGWARVGTVGNHISNQSSFDPRNYGYAKLSRLLEASGLFDVRDEGLTTVAVRDRKVPGQRSSGRRASRAAGAAGGGDAAQGTGGTAAATKDIGASAPTATTATKAPAKTAATKRTSRGGRAR